VAKNHFDLVITDLVMDEPDGMEVLRNTKELSPETMVMILTGYGDMESVVNALRLGADDYLVKPCDIQEINFRVSKCLEKQRLNREFDRQREALQESEERYRALFERSLEMVYLCDFEGNFIDANDAALELLGYTKKDIKSLNLSSLLDKDQLSLAFETVEEILKTGSQREVVEFKLRRKDGEYIYVESMGAVIYREVKPYAIQGIARDITDRKLAEEALRDSEEKYRTILEDMEEGYYEVDLAGNFTFFNDSLLKIRGYSKDELKGMSYREYMDERTAKKVYEVYNEVYSTGIPVKGLEWKITRRDGTTGYVETSISLIKDSKGEPTGFRGVVRDVTERKLAEEERTRLEDQLQKARKMEAMGLMAGGIAHDLNNILSGIVSYPELILMDLPEDSPFRNPIKVMQESGMRAADVVEDLMTIAKGAASSKEVLDLNSAVREYLDSAEHKKLESTHSFVTFKAQFDSDLLNVNGSRTHIKKTLTNLVANASEAIEGVGTVTISTTNRYLDESLKGYEDVRTGEYAVLGVSDDGSGISPQDLERIFEPFYTKKVMGRAGTGLGLAVVWNTVQDHQGYIDVRSSNEGTIFELYFPVTREKVAAEEEEVPLEEYLGNGEKILVVDDEERQREIACWLLTRLGYTVEAVSSGEEAIEYVKENPVDLIVLDMVMPKGINGRKAYEEIIKIRPGQKAIIASGFAKTREVDIAQELGAGKYIKKPYVLEKIGVAVKKELEK